MVGQCDFGRVEVSEGAAFNRREIGSPRFWRESRCTFTPRPKMLGLPGGVMIDTEAVGWLAASLTMLAFSQRKMLPLRAAAIGSNLSFIGYGVMAHLYPVMALHLVLFPCNAFRLAQLLQSSSPRRSDPGTTGDVARSRDERQITELRQEILQPLTAMMLYSQMLHERLGPGLERDAVEGLLACIRDIEEIVCLKTGECHSQGFGCKAQGNGEPHPLPAPSGEPRFETGEVTGVSLDTIR